MLVVVLDNPEGPIESYESVLAENPEYLNENMCSCW